MKTLIVRAALGAAVATLGCAGEPETPTGEVRPLATPAPRSVEVELDRAHASTELIRADAGGVVFAEGGDGTTYVLTVPSGALLGDTEITIVPIERAPGLPVSGGFVAGAHLEPSGLRFMTAATLEVEPAEEIPVAEQVSFAYRSTGQELHLAPLEPDPTLIAFRVTHFSGAILGRGSAADIADALLHPPTAPEDQLAQRVSEQLHNIREQLLEHLENGGTEDDFEPDEPLDIEKHFREVWERVVWPKLVAAETNDRIYWDAAYTYYGWARSLLLLGFPESTFARENAQALEPLQTGLRNVYERASERCDRTADIREVSTMLQAVRFAVLTFHDEDMFDDVFVRIERCGAFELVFTSRTIETATLPVYNMVYDVASTDEVRAVVPIRPTTDSWRITGSSPLEYIAATMDAKVDIHSIPMAGSEYSGKVDECQMRLTGRTNGVFTVHSLDFVVDSTSSTAGAPARIDFIVALDPGTPMKRVAMQCSNGLSDPGAEESEAWVSTWRTNHHLEADLASLDSNGVPNQWIIKDWEYIGGAVIARKTYSRTERSDLGSSTEETIIELRRP